MSDKIDTNNQPELLDSIIGLIDQTRHFVAKTVNQELTLLYWKIGKSINEEILKNDRADYGKKIIPILSEALTKKYGIGFNKRNLQSFIKLNAVIEDFTILHTVCAKLSWSHIRALIYIEDYIKREFYIQMSIHERWSVRTLQERIDSMLFERTAISKKPEQTILNDLASLKNEKQISPDLTFRDPYFLDFLGLHDTYSEKDLESSILAQLQNFITEMGSEFAFLARQKRIIIDDEDFYIDLLFYHRGLRRLVAIDLKLGKFKAGYKGQMELYLRWLEKNEQKEGENKPIGLILCSEKSPEQINYLMLDNDEQIKVSAYLTQLPEKKLLLEKLERAIAIAENNIHK
ncbi:putative nuclease of restriction endonuclease-like (RecB) superfamily [Flavobacterium sp. 90]|uniref:PDDEXK nuclease domain-containing protein n=1 Tax=unclassified Flavobacterium TaxID=196869 RepID=UPI000EB40A32|nr:MULTISPECIES: PDDEXK nuclease domain-containing protein [unclassified Flavobacterium]RKR11170.1 putative nuclease of restriction endonuclease-like (RecB) superfamily [Flavobacterium sp. 81]TCK54951.1 putative nuclease of restriction endonuclease-like (RecB) superfamily [Flavobacterium sp. 90]